MSALRLTGLVFTIVCLAAMVPGLAHAQGDGPAATAAAPALDVDAQARTGPKRERTPLPVFDISAGIGPQRYTIRPGDTLYRIATRFGVGLDVITEANGLTERSILREGMEIVIPWSNEAGTATRGADGPVVNGRGLHFVAGISDQTCWLFDGSTILRRWPCSTGRPDSPSIPGNYTIQSKLPRGYSEPAEFWMPHWLGIYDAPDTENGIHGLPYDAATGEQAWVDDLGTPITYGCIMLDDRAARELFEVADIGMPVTILQ